MKMPNLASLYHSGAWYFCSDSQSGRYGPWWSTRSTSLSRAERGASYFALAFCHAWSITLGSSVAVGAVGEAAVCEYMVWGKAAKHPRVRQSASRPTEAKERGIGVFFLVALVTVFR